jgi:hypothetical protein
LHDELTKLIAVFLKVAGYIDAKPEDRTWDVGPWVAQAWQDLGRNLHQHRRPNTVCRHPHSYGRVYAPDPTIAWRGMANAGLSYAEPGWAAAKAEARKNTAYATTLEWHAKLFGIGELFVPLSFAISGAWGVGMWELFVEGCKLTGRQRSADLFHCPECFGIYWILEAAPKCRSRPRPGALLGSCSHRRGLAATWDVDPANEHSRFGF